MPMAPDPASVGVEKMGPSASAKKAKPSANEGSWNKPMYDDGVLSSVCGPDDCTVRYVPQPNVGGVATIFDPTSKGGSGWMRALSSWTPSVAVCSNDHES